MPSVSFQHYTLDYPPWALEFDPYNRGYVVVGGGGGQDQKEVPNRLTLLDLSNRSTITQVAEIDVTDDSPSSLGLLAAKDGVFILAGINSPVAAQKYEKNDHLRSFKATFPVKGKGQVQEKGNGQIEALGKNQLFSKDFAISKDAFQRVLRLSPAHIRATGNKRIGAIASSFSSKSEVVIFDATVASPTINDMIARLEPQKNAEANDIDIWEVEPESFMVAYCTATAVYSVPVSFDFAKRKLRSKASEPTLVYEVNTRPAKLRSIRFISANHILLLLNRGPISELLILRTHESGEPGDIVLRLQLNKRLGSAVSMDVCSLDVHAKTGDKQVIVAVAGQSKDITVFTINVPTKGSPTSIKTFLELKDVHDTPMKRVMLSPFHSPYNAPGATTPAKGHEAQFVRLASISLSKSLVVEYLPLELLDKESENRRYVLNNAGPVGRLVNASSGFFTFAFILLSIMFLVQSYLDTQSAQGKMQPYSIIPFNLRSVIAGARKDNDPIKHVIEETFTADGSPGQRLADLLNLHGSHDHSSADRKAIIVRPDQHGSDQFGAEVDHHKDIHADPNAKKWDDLTKKQQDSWKHRLVKAGQWTTDEGETVLKGIFFSEVAGAIGRAAVGALG